MNRMNLLSRTFLTEEMTAQWFSSHSGRMFNAVTLKNSPIVATSYSITEHWQSGTQTRNIPWLVEVQPQPFVENLRRIG